MSLIYETNECDIRTPDIYRFSQVDGLSTGPPVWGCHSVVSELSYTITCSMMGMDGPRICSCSVVPVYDYITLDI